MGGPRPPWPGSQTQRRCLAALLCPKVIGLLRGRPGLRSDLRTWAPGDLCHPLCVSQGCCVLLAGLRPGRLVAGGCAWSPCCAWPRGVSRGWVACLCRRWAGTRPGRCTTAIHRQAGDESGRRAASHARCSGPLRGLVCCHSDLKQPVLGAGAPCGGDCACLLEYGA